MMDDKPKTSAETRLGLTLANNLALSILKGNAENTGTLINVVAHGVGNFVLNALDDGLSPEDIREALQIDGELSVDKLEHDVGEEEDFPVEESEAYDEDDPEHPYNLEPKDELSPNVEALIKLMQSQLIRDPEGVPEDIKTNDNILDFINKLDPPKDV